MKRIYSHSSVFIVQVEEKKGVIQWERFSNFIMLVKTAACVKKALSKHKPATLVAKSALEKQKSKGKHLQANTTRTGR